MGICIPVKSSTKNDIQLKQFAFNSFEKFPTFYAGTQMLEYTDNLPENNKFVFLHFSS